MNEIRELRRKLWELAKKWELDDSTGTQCVYDLRQVLTYPMATEEDEAEVQRAYGKTTEQLADEAEAGYALPQGYDARHEENVWRARHGLEQL
jgi:hypothetical protein